MGEQRPDPLWDDLVDRLAVYDVCYLTGGSAWDGKDSPYQAPGDVDIHGLVRDLAHAPQARMRNALVALLFRHPEHAPAALEVAAELAKDDRARLLIQASVLVAASLRAMWSFVLAIYLPGQSAIRADHLAHELGVAEPGEDYGRACIAMVADLLRAGQPFPFNHESEWNDVAGHILEDLRVEARLRSA